MQREVLMAYFPHTAVLDVVLLGAATPAADSLMKDRSGLASARWKVLLVLVCSFWGPQHGLASQS